jgi:hypothetical protein
MFVFCSINDYNMINEQKMLKTVISAQKANKNIL